jgi:hypothetical protein
MTNTGGSTTPAGWFNDPGGSGQMRWWDGSAWTAHLAPQPTPEPVAVPVAVPVVQAPAILTPAAQPYVPFQGSWNAGSYPAGGSVRDADFARPAQWNTAGAWFLAFSYLFTLIVALVYVVVASPGLALESPARRSSDIAIGSVWIQVALWVLQILFTIMDRRKLRSFGYSRPASFWWILLLPPLIYLIMRGVVISREVRHGFAPLITYLVSAGAIVVLGIGSAVLIPVFLSQRAGSIASTEFTSSLQAGLDEKGGHYTVTCPPTLPTTVGATFTCTAVDSSGTSHALNISIVQGADGHPTTKLLSVSPPIAG